MKSHQDRRTAAELPTKGATKDATHDASFCVGQWFAFRKSDPKGLQSDRKMAHFRGPHWSVRPASSEQSTSAGVNFCQPAQERNPQSSICCHPLQRSFTSHYSQGSLTSYVIISAACHIHLSPTIPPFAFSPSWKDWTCLPIS